MLRYLSKSMASSCPSLDKPSFFINKFCAATTAGARWKAFFVNQVLRRGRDVRPEAFFCRLGGGVARAYVATELERTHTKDVGIVRITPLIICASSARLDVLTNAGDESDAGSSEGGGLNLNPPLGPTRQVLGQAGLARAQQKSPPTPKPV
jgi:hypothetical protein